MVRFPDEKRVELAVHALVNRPRAALIEMSTRDSSAIGKLAIRAEIFFHGREVIRLAFFPLTDSIASRSFKLEHRRFDAILGANLSPTFLSRDLPLFRECTPARREAQRIMRSPPT